MTWPSLDSCTDPATMVMSIVACAQRRPAAQVLSAKVMTPVLFASLVTVSPAVASLARRETRARGALSAWSSRSRWACLAPFLLGEGQAVQYSLKPCSRARTRIPSRPAENYLRDVMIKTLEAGAVDVRFHGAGTDRSVGARSAPPGHEPGRPRRANGGGAVPGLASRLTAAPRAQGLRDSGPLRPVVRYLCLCYLLTKPKPRDYSETISGHPGADQPSAWWGIQFPALRRAWLDRCSELSDDSERATEGWGDSG